MALVNTNTPDSKATSSAPTGSLNHNLSYSPPPLSPGGEAEVSGPNELDDAPPEDRIRVDQAGQCAAQEALTQARERPGSSVLERRRPMPVDVPGTDGIVEQRTRLQGGDDAPAERLAAAGMPCAEIDDLQPVRCLSVRQSHEAIACPYLVLGRLFRFSDPSPHFSAVGLVELSSEDALGDLMGNSPPGKQQLDTLSQFPSRLSDAPDQRCGIESRRSTPLLGPLADAFRKLPTLTPFFHRIKDHQRQLWRVLYRVGPSSGK